MIECGSGGGTEWVWRLLLTSSFDPSLWGSWHYIMGSLKHLHRKVYGGNLGDSGEILRHLATAPADI